MQQRLKVLFAPAWYPSEDKPAGGTFVREHARAASICNDILVLYAYGDSSPSLKPCRITEESDDGIRTIKIRYGGILSYLWRKLRVAKQRPRSTSDSSSTSNTRIKHVVKLLAIPKTASSDLLYSLSIFIGFGKLLKESYKPDIIHAHVFTAGVPAVILGKIYGIPVVITEHWSAFPRHTLTLYQRLKARFAMNRSQIILPVSDDLGKSIQSYNIVNRFMVIPNTVDTEMFSPLPSQNEEEWGENVKLLLVASLKPVKGISYLLEALSQIKKKRQDFVLNIVGDGPNRAEYEELTKKLMLQDRVNFHGVRPKEEVSQFMRNCDFYVQPSLMETFGVTYIEAMLCGKPIVASSLPVLEEIVNGDTGLLAPPKDVEALRKTIQYMLDHYQDYSPEKIAQYARDRFSYEVVGKTLNEVYKELMEGRK